MFSIIGKIVKPKPGSRARLQIIEKLKKELIKIIASSEDRDIADYCDHIVDAAIMETEFKKDKTRAKSNFTRSRNKLLLLVEEQAMPSLTGVRDACQKMDTCMEIAMEVLARFSDFYIKNKQLQKSKIVC